MGGLWLTSFSASSSLCFKVQMGTPPLGKPGQAGRSSGFFKSWVEDWGGKGGGLRRFRPSGTRLAAKGFCIQGGQCQLVTLARFPRPGPEGLSTTGQASRSHGLPPRAYHMVPNCTEHACVRRMRPRPQTRTHTRRGAERGGRQIPQLPRSLLSFSRLREKLCRMIQIYFNTLNTG